MASNSTLLDGDYSRFSPVGVRRVTFPFRQFGDRVTRGFEEDGWQREATYSPCELGIPHPTESAFYLVAETNPVRLGVADILTFTRTWSRIPADVVSYPSKQINKPNPSSLGTAVGQLMDYTSSILGSSLGTAYSYGGALFVNNQVYPRKVAATASRVAPTGGTYTITFGASTTAALNYNDSAATIAAAINGLASVITAGITVSVPQALSVSGTFQLTLTAGATASLFTINAASLTPAASSIGYSFGVSTTVQHIGIATRVTVTAHGFSSSLPLVINTSSADVTQYRLAYGTSWTIVDANTLAVVDANGLSPTYVSQLSRSYTPGIANVGFKQLQRFYLPGITTGITTGADIPLPAPLLNDANFLTAVISTLSGYLDYDSTPRGLYQNTVFYTQTFEQIDMATV